jgi:hypothetical protein
MSQSISHTKSKHILLQAADWAAISQFAGWRQIGSILVLTQRMWHQLIFAIKARLSGSRLPLN